MSDRSQKPATRRIVEGAENRYGVVLVLIALTYAVSAANIGPGGTAFVLIAQLVMLWLVFTVSQSRKAQQIAAVAAVVGTVVALGSLLLSRRSETLTITEQVLFSLSVCLYFVAPVVILRHLYRRNVVDGRALLGAVCAYLLIGMMFAFTYRAVSLLVLQPPFFGSAGPGQTSDMLFFSFVTLTTTGYGDLVPAANPGQSIAVVEAIVGQLFLIVAFSKIVTAWRGPTRGETT